MFLNSQTPGRSWETLLGVGFGFGFGFVALALALPLALALALPLALEFRSSLAEHTSELSSKTA